MIALVALLFLKSNCLDYSQNGKNWNSSTCQSGNRQSPINIQTYQVETNQYVKFQINYNVIENGTLLIEDNGNKLSIKNPISGSILELWNERGEYFYFTLDYFQWKLGSEHTLDNRQLAAELQIFHKQAATNRKAVLSILFDEELSIAQNTKTCFVDSFKFTSYQNYKDDLEIPLREYLQYIPQDFYYYYGSMNEPPCTEMTTWIVMKQPQAITKGQTQQIKAIVSSNTGNYRNIQALNSRTVYLSGARQGSPIYQSNSVINQQIKLVLIMISFGLCSMM